MLTNSDLSRTDNAEYRNTIIYFTEAKPNSKLYNFKEAHTNSRSTIQANIFQIAQH